MKSVRTIENLAYGPGTPDELADRAPGWEDLLPLEGYRSWENMGPGNEFQVFPNDPVETDPGWWVSAPTEAAARWFLGCLIAHQAGCPPHWADMGFTSEWFVSNDGVDEFGWSFRSPHDGTQRRRFSVHADSPNSNNGNRWEVSAARVDGRPIKGTHHYFKTELEARQYVYDLIKEMEQ